MSLRCATKRTITHLSNKLGDIMIQIIIIVLAGAMILLLLHKGLTCVIDDISALIEIVRDKYNKIRGKS